MEKIYGWNGKNLRLEWKKSTVNGIFLRLYYNHSVDNSFSVMLSRRKSQTSDIKSFLCHFWISFSYRTSRPLPYTKLSAKKSLNPVAIPYRKSVYIGVRHERQCESGKEKTICGRGKVSRSPVVILQAQLEQKGRKQICGRTKRSTSAVLTSNK